MPARLPLRLPAGRLAVRSSGGHLGRGGAPALVRYRHPASDAGNRHSQRRSIKDGTISSKIAKTVFEALWSGAGDTDTVIAERGLKQMSDAGELAAIVARIVADNPGQVAQFRAGKDKVLGFFVGQVMKATQGKANPAQVNELLRDALK